MKLKLTVLVLLVAVVSHALLPGALAQQSPLTSTQILKTSESWNGTPIAYPEGTPEVSAFIVELAPGAETGWHAHPMASFGMILEGELLVELKDGSKNALKAGDAVVEVVDAFHNGIDTGSVPMKLVVFYTGVHEQPLTVMKQRRHLRNEPNG